MDDSKKHFLFIALIISLITVSAIIYIVITQPTRIEISKDLISKLDSLTEILEGINQDNHIELRTQLEKNINDYTSVLIKANDGINPPKNDKEIDEIKVILKDLNSKTDKMKNLFEHKKKFYKDFESLDKLFELN